MTPEEVLSVARELQLLCAPMTDVTFHGTSMEPLLRDGDRVILEAVDPVDIRPGDIITYRYLDRYPTRRVVERRSDRFQLSCDNWPGQTFCTTADDVLGRVVARVRDGERLTVTHDLWRQLQNSAVRAYRRRQLRRSVRSALGRLRRAVSKTASG